MRKSYVAISFLVPSLVIVAAATWYSFGRSGHGAGPKAALTAGPPDAELSSETSGSDRGNVSEVQVHTQKRSASDTTGRSVEVAQHQQEKSPLFDVVSEEQLNLDIEAYHAELDRLGRKLETPDGLTFYVTPAPDQRDVSQAEDPAIIDELTVEELVEFAKLGDVSAMFELAHIAFSAGRWEEGEAYAVAAARHAQSSAPLMLTAQHRHRQWNHREVHLVHAASWYLATYRFGDMSAAGLVSYLFEGLGPNEQAWAVEDSSRILSQIEQGDHP